jgi:hypothetical protein
MKGGRNETTASRKGGPRTGWRAVEGEIEDIGMPDEEAVQVVKKEFNLTKKEESNLSKVLCQLKEDALLIIRRRANWAAGGLANANAVLDSVATYGLAPPGRRDSKPGCYRWIFQFKDSSAIPLCRAATLGLHGHAFSLSQSGVAVAVAAGANTAALRRVPLGDAMIIHKLSPTTSDVQPYSFYVH